MAIAVFPFTPSFTHGEHISYRVTINKFEDQTEQRYLESRQEGLRLTYEFHYPVSSQVRDMRDFFAARPGQAGFFTVMDHRTGVSHTARFADATFAHDRAVAMIERLNVSFLTVQLSGMDPVAAAFTRAPVRTCVISGTLSISTPGLPDGVIPPPDSGTVVGSTITSSTTEFAVSADIDYQFWRIASNGLVNAWYLPIEPIVPRDNPITETNRLHAIPFLSPRSGMTLSEIAIHRPPPGVGDVNSLQIAIYQARSSATVDMYPGALLATTGKFTVPAASTTTRALVQQLAGDTLYFIAYVSGTLMTMQSADVNENDVQLGHNGVTGTPVYAWQVVWSGGVSVPATYPSGAIQLQQEIPLPALKFV